MRACVRACVRGGGGGGLGKGENVSVYAMKAAP